MVKFCLGDIIKNEPYYWKRIPYLTIENEEFNIIGKNVIKMNITASIMLRDIIKYKPYTKRWKISKMNNSIDYIIKN